ncbi:MAG: hypothetical protein P8J86_08415 [Phycisphaerales bacterium]|nr:hypothetical protein [Phycisphaerales bacterium]
MSGFDDIANAIPLAPTLSTLGRSPRAVIDRLAEAGFSALELGIDQPAFYPRALDSSSRRGLISLLRQRGLVLAGLDAFFPPALFHDPVHVDQVVSNLMDAIDLAGDLSTASGGFGAVGLGVHFPALGKVQGKHEPASDGTAVSEDSAQELSSVVAVIERAAHRGVPLIDFRTDGLWAERDLVMRGVDCLAVLQNGGDPVKAVHSAGDRLLGLRLGDQNPDGTTRPLEDGARCFDLLALKVALAVNGFERPVVVSARGWPDPWAGLIQTQQAWASHAG